MTRRAADGKISKRAQARGLRDIPDQEALLRAILDAEPECVKLVASDGSLLSMNPAGLAMIEADSLDQVKGQSFYPFVAKEHLPAFRALTERVFRGESGTLEFWARGLKGTSRWLEIRAVPLRNSTGEIVALLGVTRDITERKQAAEALRDRERQLSSVTDNLPGLVSRVDRDLRYLFVNAQYERLFGLPSASIVGRRIPEVIGADAFARFEPNIKRALAGERVTFESWIKTASGDLLYGRATYVPDVGPDGTVQGLFTLVTDVTERKRAEEALREREEQLHLFVEHSPAAIAMFDRDMRYLAVSRRWITDFNLGDQNLVGRCHYEVFPEIPERWKEVHRRCLSGAVERCEEDPFLRADGRTDWVRWEVRPWRRADGAIGGVVIFTEVITERKSAEEERRAISYRNEALVTALGQIVYEWRPLADKLIWEGDYTKVLGYLPEEMGDTTDSWTSRVHPNDLKRVFAEVEGATRGRRPFDSEYRFRHRDGSYRWMHDCGVLSISARGELERVVGVFSDVTEQKEAEEALQEAEARLRLAMHAGRIGMWDWNKATGQIVWSRGHEELWGLPPGAFQGTYEEFDARLHPDDRDGLNCAVAQAIAERRVFRHEFRVIWLDGSIHWIAGQGEPFFNDAGQPVRMVGVVTDISERKRAEEEANKLITLIENSSDFIGAADLQGKFVYLNKAGCDLLGLESPAAAAGTTIPDCIAQEDQALLRNVVLPQIFQNGHWHGELRFRHFKTGRSIPEDCSGFLIKDAATGKPQLIATVSRDLSERKLTEEALREHSQRLQMLSQRLVQVQEDEARRIGRELHDDLGQILTMLKIKVQTLPRQKDARSFEEQVADLTMTVDQAIERTRTISADLRPAMLDDLGLEAALRWMLDRQAQQTGLKGMFAVHGVEKRLPPELETTCYRVAQEALTNVVRHAGAKHVRIELQREESELHLSVSDDGTGFDADKALSEILRGKNLGLLGMQERVALMGGRFTIRSAHGQGTDVRAWFPRPHAAPGRPEP